MNRRKAITGLIAAPLFPVAASAWDDADNVCRCVCMEEREGAFVLEGKGDHLTEAFELDPGAYRIEVEMQNPDRGDISIRADFFLRADGDKDDYFSITYMDEMPDFASGMLHLTGGEYLAEVRGFGGDWKIVLSPI